MSKRVHDLKTWPEPFSAILDGRKRFEVRKDDRAFAVGDELYLREWDPSKVVDRSAFDARRFGYTGREMRVVVTYILHGGRFGLPADMCVMGIEASNG